MKKILLAIMVFTFAQSVFAQNNCSIKKGYAFFTVNTPGTRMQDDKGNDIVQRPFLERYIYIESNGTSTPAIETIMYDNVSLKTTITKVEGSQVTAGKKLSNGADHKLSTHKGTTLWKIDLHTDDQAVLAKRNFKNIIINMKSSGKPCKYIIKKEVELQSIPRY